MPYMKSAALRVDHFLIRQPLNVMEIEIAYSF